MTGYPQDALDAFIAEFSNNDECAGDRVPYTSGGDLQKLARAAYDLGARSASAGSIGRDEQWGRQQRIELLELALEQYAMRPGPDGEIARIALKNAAPQDIERSTGIAPQPAVAAPLGDKDCPVTFEQWMDYYSPAWREGFTEGEITPMRHCWQAAQEAARSATATSEVCRHPDCIFFGTVHPPSTTARKDG